MTPALSARRDPGACLVTDRIAVSSDCEPRMLGMFIGLVFGGAIIGTALRPLWAAGAAFIASAADALLS